MARFQQQMPNLMKKLKFVHSVVFNAKPKLMIKDIRNTGYFKWKNCIDK